jgi:hypothetical protein
MKGKLQEELG